MSNLQQTPSGERVHIAFFGCRNAGKSSLLNAVTGQQMAIVSPVKGTTTDPVYKSMELLPAGPVVIIDTPGIDDEGDLGMQRIEGALRVLRKTDVAVLVVDGTRGLTEADQAILSNIRQRNIPCLIAVNKSDLGHAQVPDGVPVSARTGEGIFDLKERIARLALREEVTRPLTGDLVSPGDMALLVMPIDKAAPKGRLILPQQETIRDLLDHGAIPVCVRDRELPQALEKLGHLIRLVITDSQAFGYVSECVPQEMPLTSFSILFARYKGEAQTQLKGVAALKSLRDGDKVLIAEGCTHHRQCGDIGTQKIPAMLKKCTGKTLDFSFTSGQEFPADPGEYRLVIHCGGCMLNAREMAGRIALAKEAHVPVTNYGMVIAYANGILERSLRPFPALHQLLGA